MKYNKETMTRDESSMINGEIGGSLMGFFVAKNDTPGIGSSSTALESFTARYTSDAEMMSASLSSRISTQNVQSARENGTRQVNWIDVGNTAR
jgi:ABC-type xylose transport system substrate-binding protein